MGDTAMSDDTKAAEEKALADKAAEENALADKAAADKAAEEGAPEGTDLAADVAKWKAMARKHEAQSKANADKAKQLDDLEEANKTELEKEKARGDRAEKALADIAAAKEASKLRDEIAKEKGVAASVLRGSTREELEAHADELASAFKIEKPKAPPADGQGNAGTGVHGDGDMSAEDVVTAALKR